MFIFIVKGWLIAPIFTLAYFLYSTYRHIFIQTIEQIFMFDSCLMETWTMDVWNE